MEEIRCNDGTVLRIVGGREVRCSNGDAYFLSGGRMVENGKIISHNVSSIQEVVGYAAGIHGGRKY